MWKFVMWYFIIQILLLVVILLITNKTDKKSKLKFYKPNEVPEGFKKTSESFIDTKTQNVVYVYYNKTSGKRIYVIH